MSGTPELIPAHAGCPRGCTDCCRTAAHIKLVQTNPQVHNDLKSRGIQEQLAECKHLTNTSSPSHDIVAELMLWTKKQGTQTESNLLTSLGLPEDQADLILEDNEETDEAI